MHEVRARLFRRPAILPVAARPGSIGPRLYENDDGRVVSEPESEKDTADWIGWRNAAVRTIEALPGCANRCRRDRSCGGSRRPAILRLTAWSEAARHRRRWSRV